MNNNTIVLLSFFFFLYILLFFAHLVVFLHILLFCTFFFFIAHFTLISPLLTICMPLCFVTLYNLYSYYFALSTERTWFDYISLLIIPCITIMWQIKKPWTLNLDLYSWNGVCCFITDTFHKLHYFPFYNCFYSLLWSCFKTAYIE